MNSRILFIIDQKSVEEEGQYHLGRKFPFVVTTSGQDSSMIRQWFQRELKPQNQAEVPETSEYCDIEKHFDICLVRPKFLYDFAMLYTEGGWKIVYACSAVEESQEGWK